MPTPLQCMMVNIARWEGLWQDYSSDPGNWLDGRLIGTMRGVTPAVLAAHLGVAHSVITPAFMRERVTLQLAAEIGLRRFYQGWIDPLRWNAAADVVTDFGWGSGPGQAVKSTERDFLGLANADFRFDVASCTAWASRCERDGVERMVRGFYDVRERFYDLICVRNPELLKFRGGWHNRSEWMLPGGEWWAHWLGENTAAVIASADAAPSNPMPVALLSRGMRGADVKRFQMKLIEAGYALPRFGADGHFGGETDDVLRRFQADRKLAVDGWVGNETRRELKMAA